MVRLIFTNPIQQPVTRRAYGHSPTVMVGKA